MSVEKAAYHKQIIDITGLKCRTKNCGESELAAVSPVGVGQRSDGAGLRVRRDCDVALWLARALVSVKSHSY